MKDVTKKNSWMNLYLWILLMIFIILAFSLIGTLLTAHLEYAIVGITIAVVLYVLNLRLKKG